MKAIGETFGNELQVAGLAGLPFSWGADGTFQFDDRMTQAQIDAVNAVYAAHDPTATLAPPPDSLSDLVTTLLNKGILESADLPVSISAMPAIVAAVKKVS
jgi:hypothetical protein